MFTQRYAGRLAVMLVTAAVAACVGHPSDEPPAVDPSTVRDSAEVATPPSAPAGPVLAREPEIALKAGETGRRPVRSVTDTVSARVEGRVSPDPATTSMQLSGMPALAAPAYSRPGVEPQDRENYAHLDGNPVRVTATDPVSTFSIDVDTGSYSNVRRFLAAGRLPPADAVRAEEMINYFDYDYPVPEAGGPPFSVSTELSATPWNAATLLMQVGIKGYQVSAEDRAPANLVFLIDVSGSMQSPDKLPLLKSAFRLLAGQLDGRDRVAIAVYAGSSGVVLEPTPGDRGNAILEAIDSLSAGGSTNGAAGIRLAYQLAREGMIEGGINRVVLATDGDFNVGTVNFEALVDLVAREKQSGVSLTTLGFGSGNYNDRLMERLADAGDGNHGYVDSLAEARKLLVEQVSSTLQTIARDVKIQIEFNPAVVAEYRLIGYENRLLNREDFNNDQVDAGEIGAGHTVTALYELALTGSEGTRIDPLRYGSAPVARGKSGELAFLRLRYKAPDADASELLEYPVYRGDILPARRTSDSFRFAAAVAAFGQRLSGAPYLGEFGFGDIAALAGQAAGDDAGGYRSQFLDLVREARALSEPAAPVKVSGGPAR